MAEEIIIDFTINVEEALENITQARLELEKLRQEQAEIKKAMKDGSATDDMIRRYGELAVEIKDTNRVISENNKLIQNQIKQNEAAQGSLAQIRSALANLKNEYTNLSQAEREGAKGKELIDKMNQLNLSAKEVQARMNGVPAGMAKTVAAMQQMGPTAGRAAAAISKINLAFKALLANPIVLAIAAIVAVIKKLVDSFKKNDQAMTTLQKSMAPFKAILNAIERAFQAIVSVVAKVIEWYGKLYSKMVSIIPFMKDYVKQQEDIVESTDKLQDAEREYSLESQKRQNEISELRNKAKESEKYTVEERREFLKQALEIEKTEAKEKKKIADEKLRIAKQEALAEIGYTEMTDEAWAKLSDEQKDAITALEVSALAVEEEMNNASRRMISELNSFDKEIRQQEEAAQKEAEEKRKKAADAYKQRVANEKQALQELEDLTIESMKNLQEKEIKQLEVSNARQIDSLRERLRTETNLSAKAREAINQQIVLLETDLQIKIGEVNKKYTEERLKKQVDMQKKYYEELLKNAGGEEAIAIQTELTKMAYDTEINAFEERKKYLQENLDQLSGEAKVAAEQEIEDINRITEVISKNKEMAVNKVILDGKDAIEAVKEANRQLEQEISDTRLLGVFANNELEKTKIAEQQSRNRLAIAEKEYTRIKNMSEDEKNQRYKTEEEYQNAVKKSELVVVQSQNAVAEAVKNTNEAINQEKIRILDTFGIIANSLNGLVGAFGDLFSTLSEDDARMQKFANAMAYTQIMMDLAQGISGAVAQAQSMPYPANIAAMISGVAAVTSAIGSAIALYKQNNKVANPPRFAEGGLVGGKTSERTDDSVDAKLSVGEYVVRSSAVRSVGVNALNTLNSSGRLPQNTFNYEVMRDILVEAVSQIEPQVSVKEIVDLEHRINVKENISKY